MARRFAPTLEALEDRTLLHAGALDPTFGTGGILLGKFSPNTSAAAVAVQTDGKVVVAGSSSGIDTSSLLIARYTADGKPDTTFGHKGLVTLTPSLGAEPFDSASALALLPNGKILVAGTAGSPSHPAEFLLARLDSDGTPDPTFGNHGIVLTSFGTPGSNFRVDAAASALAVQADGKIVLAGSATFTWEGRVPPPSGFTLYTDFALARYNAGGSLDKSFGNAGEVVTSFGFTAPVHGTDQASAIALQSDGKIVVAGTASEPSPVVASQGSQFALARYDPDGSLDQTFGSGGLVRTSVVKGAQNDAAGVVVTAFDHILVAGTANGRFALAQYTSAGNLNTTFGTGGTVTTAIHGTQSSTAAGLVVTAQGRIVVAGTAQETGNHQVFALARYDAHGKLDSRFGSGGTVLTSIGSSASADAIALQTDGKVLVAGSAFAPPGLRLVVARYEGDFALDTASGITGQALVGPITPISHPGQPNTRPLAGAIIDVETANGSTLVAQVVADDNGMFRLALAPGRYRLVPLPPKPGEPYPHGFPQSVVVEAGEFTSVTVNYDSGIR
jgi:uncharacterized delta-60 repeat protein